MNSPMGLGQRAGVLSRAVSGPSSSWGSGSRERWLGVVARASLLLFVPAPWDRTSDPRSSCVFLPGTLLTLLHVLCFLPGLVFFPFPSGFPCPLSSAALGPAFPCQSIHPMHG